MKRSHGLIRPLSIIAAASLISACSGGGGGGTPAPSRTPTPAPTVTPTPMAITGGGTVSATCSTTSGAAVARNASKEATRRRQVARVSRNAAHATGLVAVTYAGVPTDRATMEGHERALGANLRREFSFSHTGAYIRVLAVTPGTEDAAIASLRSQAGVVNATVTGEKRYREAVTTPYYPNDPYYNGFTTAQNVTAGNAAAPATYHTACDEAASVPGQWDMHIVRLEHAMAYSQSGNGSGITDTGALGKSSIKLADIDSGQDTTHPELASKIVYQKSFVTQNGRQTVTNSTNDKDGHGTDTSGLAVDSANNGIGFVGTGGNVSLMGYQVFPVPDDTCVAGGNNPDDTCGADTADIADAIKDAVANGASVISLSLGGGGCTGNGTDEDSVEGAAIADAIAANVVVVAAAGNDNPNSSSVSAPGCDSGVIAAGATSLDDGQANGSNHTGGTATAPVEYVASYSQRGSPAKAANSASAWGIVAPGGDPTGSDDADDLHWIENIWTSTPLDDKFSGNCNADYPGTGSTPDCRTLIAGTSMATPIVAGAAALIISANAAYQNPSAMKQLLCTTAHDINDPAEGCGRLDIYRAMAVAVGDNAPPASQ